MMLSFLYQIWQILKIIGKVQISTTGYQRRKNALKTSTAQYLIATARQKHFVCSSLNFTGLCVVCRFKNNVLTRHILEYTLKRET